MDQLVSEVIGAIKKQDDERLLILLDNQELTLDALFASNSDDANALKMRLQTKQGQQQLEKEKLAQKIKIQTFLTTGITKQITTPLNELRMTGFEVLQNKPYAEGSNALHQKYNIVLDNGQGSYFYYKIGVVQWEKKFHLIEADAHVEKQ